MLIAQITDLHIGFVPHDADELNRQRLDAVLDLLISGPNRPDMLIVSGDITDRGDTESYARVAAMFQRCPFPVYPSPGNHDDRAAFAAVFPDHVGGDGFLHYVVERHGLRLIFVDTLEPGRHGAGFCEVRAMWLKAQVAADPVMPTVIVMHHPPFDPGIAWMAESGDAPWIMRFRDAVAGQPQIRAIWSGHFHRAVATTWNGITATICPATAAQLALDLRPIDPALADDRAMIVNDPPGYALHRWNGTDLVTLFDTAETRTTLARFDQALQPLVMHLAEERLY